MDTLDWEIEQLEKIEVLKGKYGWDDDNKDYKMHVNMIKQQAKARMKADTANAHLSSRARPSANTHQGGDSERDRAIRPKPYGWRMADGMVPIGRIACSFKDAKAIFLKDPPGEPADKMGEWRDDRQAPGNEKYRRYISIHKFDSAKYQRCRIRRLEGIATCHDIRCVCAKFDVFSSLSFSGAYAGNYLLESEVKNREEAEAFEATQDIIRQETEREIEEMRARENQLSGDGEAGEGEERQGEEQEDADVDPGEEERPRERRERRKKRPNPFKDSRRVHYEDSTERRSSRRTTHDDDSTPVAPRSERRR